MKPPIALLLAMLLAGSAGARAAGRPDLTVCLQTRNPPLSFRTDDKPAGFDLALSRAIADRLDRGLQIQWFVSRDDPDANPAKEANALLSDGHCQLVAEYPLTAGALARPLSPTGKLPPFDGAKPDDRKRWVKLGALMPTQPYRFDTLTVVLGKSHADRPVRKLADLDGLRIGVQTATLADAIAMRYDGGLLANRIVHLPDSRALFAKLRAGEIDAAFVDMRAVDAWRLHNGTDGLALSGYAHSLGFNMGFVGLAGSATLIRQVDAALADLKAHDALAPMAQQAGLTYIPPRSPDVLPDVHLAALQGD
ncbi:substrate-binding periplasmic protein [Rhodopila globiformis]|nr:transporter substrate-binding domain-containing protein [Rhodopila globiformis]